MTVHSPNDTTDPKRSANEEPSLQQVSEFNSVLENSQLPTQLPATFTVPDKTAALMKWLKTPHTDDDSIEPFHALLRDPETDALLQKEQLHNTENKITTMFGGTPGFEKNFNDKQELLLSQLAQYFLVETDHKQQETDIKQASERLAYELNAKKAKKHTFDEKHAAVKDYIKWIDNQINVSTNLREQTARRAERDCQLRQEAENARIKILEEQAALIQRQDSLRRQWQARHKWRDLTAEIEDNLGQTFYDMDDFCGFHEKNAAILELCTQMHGEEQLQLDSAQREAEIRPEEWEADNTAMRKRLQNAFVTRDELISQVIGLKELNQAYREAYETDRIEYEKLVDFMDDLMYVCRNLSGIDPDTIPDDPVQQLDIFERFLSHSDVVEGKLRDMLGPQMDYAAVFPDNLLNPNEMRRRDTSRQ